MCICVCVVRLCMYMPVYVCTYIYVCVYAYAYLYVHQTLHSPFLLKKGLPSVLILGVSGPQPRNDTRKSGIEFTCKLTV